MATIMIPPVENTTPSSTNENKSILDYLNKYYVCFILFIVTIISFIEFFYTMIKTPENVNMDSLQKILNISTQILKKN